VNLMNRKLWIAVNGGKVDIRARHILTALVLLCCWSISLALAPSEIGVMGAVLSTLMWLIAVVDSCSFTIPDEFTAAGVAFGLLHAWLQNEGQVTSAVGWAAVQGGILAALFWGVRIAYRWFRGRDGLGLGDVKLAGVAGTWLMPATIPLVIEVAALSGLLVYIVRQYLLDRPLRANGRLPFGAFLAPAIWLGWVFEIVTAGRFF
jgi:leader peptidase (prepilin peptidase)/N-methyltransferase